MATKKRTPKRPAKRTGRAKPKRAAGKLAGAKSTKAGGTKRAASKSKRPPVRSGAGERARGAFVWYELTTSDVEAAKRFYSRVVGWRPEPYEHDPTYTVWTNSGSAIGGLMVPPDDAGRMSAPPHWMAYISTPDPDETARRAEELGGKVLNGPMDIPDVGRFAVIEDPQGAVFAAFRPSGTSAQYTGQPRIGDVSWHELSATDAKAALAFYRALFGWTDAGTHDLGPAGTYYEFGRGSELLGGIFGKAADVPGPASWVYYVRVPDADRAAEDVLDAGGAVATGPMEVPGGDRIAICRDPQGAVFAVHSTKAER